MDKKIEQSNKNKILRMVAKELKNNGFTRTKTTYFVRHRDSIAEFLHFHKYSFAPAFRIHTCIRVLNDPRDWIALQGFHSQPFECPDSPNGKKYNFRFHKSDESIDRCVQNVVEFVEEVSEPWFKKWSDPTRLLENSDSPLGEEEKTALKDSFNENTNKHYIETSRKLLKLA